MAITLPDIPEHERTPLVLTLLDLITQQQECIAQQQERIARLEDEVAILKGLKPRPTLRPSTLEAPPPKPPTPGQKRPGSDKRPKNAHLAIHRDVLVPLDNPPPGAVFKGYEDYLVQELVLRAEVIRYRRERWQLPDGSSRLAPLPDTVIPGDHFGPVLQGFVLDQHHGQRVTQPLLLAQLRQLGMDISAGQVNNILTQDKETFHREKDEVLQTGLLVSPYVGVDDTGARHRGHNGSCLLIGNDLFAYFRSSDSKSRLNFLETLRQPHTDYVLNEVARSYWAEQQLSAAVTAALLAGPEAFADAAAWQAHLAGAGVTGERHVRIATEGALLGSLIEHGVSPELVVLSDGAPQFDVLVHASCWLHAERPLARMVPYSEPHRQAIEGVRRRIWELYQDLKAYRAKPDVSQKAGLEARFDALCAWRTGFPSVDGVLKEIHDHKADLLRVLERPEVPLHNNTSESHIREYVTRRKVSGGTRSDEGRRCRDTFASLKKTCRCLGVNFWEYLQDRLRGRGVVPRLAELIRGRAGDGRGEGVVAAPA
jgi:transposase IS66 family protein